MYGQDIARLAAAGGRVAFQIAREDHPTFFAVFQAGRLVEQMDLAERLHELAPEDRDRPGSHGHMHRACLQLIYGEGSGRDDERLQAAAAGLLWSGLHHPGLGARNVEKAEALLREKGHATMAFEIRNGGLWFEVFDIRPPGEPKPDEDVASNEATP
jgi:hypothetical protein